MAKKRYTVLLITLLLVVLGANPAAAAPPEIAGEAAVLVDSKNGQVLYEKNSRQKHYPASTTKVLTAIIALEHAGLDEMVTIPRIACNIEGSAIGLQEGEKMSLEDLLYSLLLNSGNDAAVAIAVHVGGSLENFIDLMNQKAAELGAVDSHFANPNGLPDPNHYSTAYDMALIARYAMQNPDFRKIVATRSTTITREITGAQVYLNNGNRLLSRYAGAIGVKTGYTVEARQCLISAAARDNRELVAVVLKSEGTIWTDSESLLDYGFNNYENITLTEAGRVVTEAPVKFGAPESVPVQTGYSLTYNFSGEKQREIRQEIILQKGITAPVKAGHKLGELAFFSGDRELGRVDLLAQREIERKFIATWRPWLLLSVGLFLISLLIRRHNLARRRRWERYRRKYYL